MSPVRYLRYSPNDSGPRRITPASYTRTCSLLQSSYTTIFFDPTTVVLRSLLGASQDNSTCAIVPESYEQVMNATSSFLSTQARPVLMTCLGRSSSQYRRIEKSCGPRSQITLTSDWYRPRLTRDMETK